jgi:hypothetical protein
MMHHRHQRDVELAQHVAQNAEARDEQEIEDAVVDRVDADIGDHHHARHENPNRHREHAGKNPHQREVEHQ